MSPNPAQISRFLVWAAYFRRSVGFFSTGMSTFGKIVSPRRSVPLDARMANGYDKYASAQIVGNRFFLFWRVFLVILELRELAQLLDRKVISIQREFTAIADQLSGLRRKWSEVEEPERPAIIKEQELLKEKQLLLAEQVNVWRDRLRAIETPAGEKALQTSLDELLGCGDAEVVDAVQNAKRLMAMDPEEKAAFFTKNMIVSANTPVGRLLERARTSYDLRSGGPSFRQEAAVEFANRSGIAQDNSVIADLEAASQNSDVIIADLAVRTLIQVLRFRAVRAAELDTVFQAVQKLVKIKNPLVIPVLVEILRTPRQGYIYMDDTLQEGSNGLSRMLALIALVDWRTREAQDAIRTRFFDKEPDIANAAERALEAFPGEWTGKTV
jgi:hypothetical protein